MLFAWDENKNFSNKRKHGLSFNIASSVFDDPYLLSELNDHFTEERWESIGLIENELIYVVHTVEYLHEEEKIRIISARAASANEARRYRINRGNEKGIASIKKS